MLISVSLGILTLFTSQLLCLGQCRLQSRPPSPSPATGKAVAHLVQIIEGHNLSGSNGFSLARHKPLVPWTDEERLSWIVVMSRPSSSAGVG